VARRERREEERRGDDGWNLGSGGEDDLTSGGLRGEEWGVGDDSWRTRDQSVFGPDVRRVDGDHDRVRGREGCG
jgi:hypothetical protein